MCSYWEWAITISGSWPAVFPGYLSSPICISTAHYSPFQRPPFKQVVELHLAAAWRFKCGLCGCWKRSLYNCILDLNWRVQFITHRWKFAPNRLMTLQSLQNGNKELAARQLPLPLPISLGLLSLNVSASESSLKSLPDSLMYWKSCWPGMFRRRMFGYVLGWQLSQLVRSVRAAKGMSHLKQDNWAMALKCCTLTCTRGTIHLAETLLPSFLWLQTRALARVKLWFS